MSIDPEELKIARLKREQQIKTIQTYLEEQDALDMVGKMGHREVKINSPFDGNISAISKKYLA